MATTNVITAKTGAETSANITVADGASIKVWVDDVLEPGESVSVIQTNGVSVEIPLIQYDLDERRPWVAQITPGCTAIRIAGPGTFKLAKSVTTESVGVYYDT